MDYASSDIGDEVHAIFEVLIATGLLAAEHARRCLPPDLIEALVAEKLDTM
jgi:hypothetical protein